ncbi:hypothetical protein SMD44_08900 [Streptomyces alboflavus]|uniref:Uncharacterized protein n=1 Tax=Streptomyces alboflavus TaxID=67267 RepID=A0A1Z1WSJ1_9ACTN|nr:hypothetical protein SMD44_08900 [Streptomyces alboflavus]
MPLVVQVRAGLLPATPRGSKETMSKRSRIFLLKSSAAPSWRNCTPDSPGPPGLNTSDPMRLAERAVSARATGRTNVLPLPGCA